MYVHVYIYMIQSALFPEGACYDALYIYILTYTVYVNKMIPVPDVIQLVFRIPCVLRLPAFQWRATEARLIFLVLGHLSQTLRLAVNPLKYNGKYGYCIPA